MTRHERLQSASLQSSELIGQESTRTTTYVKQIEKLQSIGPLNITDLQEFLYKSKIDFQNLYKDKSISSYKITDFSVIRKLGSGSFGKVILAQTKKDDHLYAIKVIDKRAVIKGKHFQYVHNEKRILQSLNFPFVVYLKYFFVDFNFLYFVMPFVPGGDFYDYLQEHKPLVESHAKFYICQLVLALEYLHYLELIHRDVKPENIMLDAFGYIKLADFGQCIRCYRNDKAWTLTGTPEYMAPEIIKAVGYSYAVDWWALGITLYEMCAGRRPFKHSSTTKLYKIIVQLSYEIPPTFTKHLTSLVKQLLANSSVKRIGGGEKDAKEVKAHAWFKNTDWLGILNRTLTAPYLPQRKLSGTLNNL